MHFSVAHLLSQATANLTTRGVPTPRLDAEVLLAHALGFSRAELFARLRDSLSEAESFGFQQLLHRRLQREPLQYITGVQEFWSLEFIVNRDVLIPRPETELVVETALRLLSQHLGVGGRESGVSKEEERQKAKNKKQKAKAENPSLDSRLRTLDSRLLPSDPRPPTPKILDVGTGSGCIAVALAKELPGVEVWATEVSSPALVVAQKNAQRHGVAERLHFLSGDLFVPLQEQRSSFDLIVSNPPYIIRSDIPALQPEVGTWEPHSALDGGPDGLNFYRRLLNESPNYLRPGGYLVMEVGHNQGAAILQLAQEQSRLTASSCGLDYEGRERVVTAQKC